MKQIEYAFGTVEEAVAGVGGIRDFIQGNKHADALLTIYTAGVGEQGANRLIAALDHELPSVKRAGATVFPQPDAGNAALPGAAAMRINLVLSENARFHVVQIPCDPDGLSGEAIPEEARIIAVADAYDAMTSNRSYRDAMPQAKVREQIVGGRGTQFDPRFTDIMLAMIDDNPEYTMRG